MNDPILIELTRKDLSEFIARAMAYGTHSAHLRDLAAVVSQEIRGIVAEMLADPETREWLRAEIRAAIQRGLAARVESSLRSIPRAELMPLFAAAKEENDGE